MKKDWIKTNWKELTSITFVLSIFIITSILKWGVIATIFGMVTFILLFIIMLAWLLDHLKDEDPLPLADFRKVKNVTVDKNKLNEAYKKDRHRNMLKSNIEIEKSIISDVIYWIPVAEKLPDLDEEVLIATKDGWVGYGQRSEQFIHERGEDKIFKRTDKKQIEWGIEENGGEYWHKLENVIYWAEFPKFQYKNISSKQTYIDWLELQATKLIILRDGLPKQVSRESGRKSKMEFDEPVENNIKQKFNMEDI